MRLKIDWVSLQLERNLCQQFVEFFTETRLEDVHPSKTQPCKYFVYLDAEIQAKSELITVTLSD